MTVEMMPSARQIALANVVVDIEKGAARVGWDHAPSIYALVPTAMLLSDPNLPADIAEQLRGGWDGSEDHLSAIIQEDLDTDDIEQVLVDGDRALVRMGDALVDVMRLDCASALLLSDGGGPPLASQLQGVVEALRASNDAMDDESAAKLVGASWEALAWARELQPLQQVEIESEEEDWMDHEGD